PCASSSISSIATPASFRQYAIAPAGKAPVCFFRLIRSSATAATILPSTSNTAAESWPCEMRYSRSSNPGQWARLKGIALSKPLIPRIFTASRARKNRTRKNRTRGHLPTQRPPPLRARHYGPVAPLRPRTARFLQRRSAPCAPPCTLAPRGRHDRPTSLTRLRTAGVCYLSPFLHGCAGALPERRGDRGSLERCRAVRGGADLQR